MATFARAPLARATPSAWAAVAVLALAALALAGWATGAESLTTFGVPRVSTKPVTAVLLAGCAVAALLGRRGGRASSVAAGLLGGLTALAGVATLGAYAGIPGVDSGLPGLGESGGALSRMSPLTALAFALVGVALAIDAQRPRRRVLAHAPALAGAAAALVGLLTLANRAVETWGVPAELQLGLPTGLGLIVLALAVVFRPPLAGPAAAVLAPTEAGMVLRAAVPLAVALAVAPSLIEAVVEGPLDRSGATAGLIESTVVLTGVLTAGWFTARRLHAAQRARAASERRAEAVLANAPVAILLADASGLPTQTNRAWSELTGLELSEDMRSGSLEVVDPRDRPAVGSAWRAAVADRAPFRMRYRVGDGSDPARWVEGRAAALPEDATGDIAWIVALTDVTGDIERDLDDEARHVISDAISRGLGRGDLMAVVARAVVTATRATRAAVLAADPSTGLTTITWDSPRGSTADPLEPLAQELLAGDTAARRWMETRTGMHALLTGPIAVDGDGRAALVADFARPDQVRPDVDDRLQAIAELAATGLSAAGAREQLTLMAMTDDLTGLLNGRAFRDEIGRAARRAARSGEALAVAVMDIDRFKQVNDRHGHTAGDTVLAEVSARLHGQTRGGDVLARVGGEEFAWVLPGSDAHGAFAAIERARAAVSASAIEPAGRITLSAGVADLEMAGADPQALVKLADAALYDAKDAGRDRTAVASAATTRAGATPPGA